jgi:hypothetical protein
MARLRLTLAAALLASFTAVPAAEPKGPMLPAYGVPRPAESGAEGLAYGADALPRLAPLARLRGQARPLQLPPAPGIYRRGHAPPIRVVPDPERCLIAMKRCSGVPCMQFVRRSALRGCDPYPLARPRMVP